MKKELMKGYRQAQWNKRRSEILKRDNYTCQHCGRTPKDGVELQVHHLTYINGHKPWEYPDYALLTLCKGCHSKEHGITPPPPGEGWVYDSWDDTEDFGAEQCEYCGSDLRYVHILYHPDWGFLRVGCTCADKLLNNTLGSEKEIEREKLAHKWKTFINSPKWKHYKNGYFFEINDVKFCIWDNESYFTLKIKKYGSSYFGGKYKTLEFAKSSAFEYLHPEIFKPADEIPEHESIQLPQHIQDRIDLLTNMCKSYISEVQRIVRPAYPKIEEVKNAEQINFVYSPIDKDKKFEYDLRGIHIGKHNREYVFYIKFLWGEPLTQQEIEKIKESNVHYFTIDCSSLLQRDKISKIAIRAFLYFYESHHLYKWVSAPAYEKYLSKHNGN